MIHLTREASTRSESATLGAPSAITPTSEFAALLCCARVLLDATHAHRLREIIRGDLNWPRLLHLADVHGLTPLIARHIMSSAVSIVNGDVPVEVREQLRARAVGTAARNMSAARQLLQVISALDAAAVPCIAFKGPLIAADVYGDLALRSFGDLDIAVPAASLLRARRALIASGYRSAHGLNEAQETALLRTYGHLVLVRGDDELPVELHWRFAPDCFPSLAVADAIARARLVQLAGRAVPSLGPEDLLLTLCIHGGKHVWYSLEWVSGVAELLRRGDVDVAATLDRANHLGAGRFVRLGLRVAYELLDAPLPDTVVTLVCTDVNTARLAAVAYRALFEAADAPERADRPIKQLGYHLRTQASLVRRLRFLRHIALLPTLNERAEVELPDWLTPAYRVVRPVRLIDRYMRSVSARVRSRTDRTR